MEKGSCKLGWYVRNVVNGYEGFVIGKVYWAFGCEQIIRMPRKYEKETQSLFSCSPKKEMVVEEFLEIMPNEDNGRFEREFTQPELDKFFGMLCKDKVTGFEGVAIGCITSMHGTDQYALEPLSKKKDRISSYEWFDVGRLEILSRHVEMENVRDKGRPGGCEMVLRIDRDMALC